MSRYIRDARSGRVCRYGEVGGSYYAEDPGAAPPARDAMMAELEEILAALSDAGLDEVLVETRRVAQGEGLHSQEAQAAAPMSERRGGRRSSGTHFAEEASIVQRAKEYAAKRNRDAARRDERQQRA